MKRLALLLAILAVPTIMLISCSKNSPTAPSLAPDQGKMMFALDAADNIATGQVTVTKGALTHVLPITITDHSGTVTFAGIQVGHWDILVQLYDEGGAEIYTGIGEAIVVKGETTTVTIRVEHNTGTLIINVEVPGLLLWSKLGSQAQVETSMEGPGGQIVGDLDYKPGKYGDGFEPQPRTGDPNIPDNFIKYENLNLGPKGCIEFWYHPDWINSSVGHVVDVMQFGIPENSSSLKINVHYNDWQNKFHYTVYSNDQQALVWKYFVPASTPGWSTIEPFHLAFTWDGTKPDASDRIKMYINGNEVGILGAVRGDPDFMNWDPNSVFYLSSRMYSGDWYRHRWEPDNGVMDNIKIWNYPKTNFSDRFME